jgi:hypothetical protein
VSARSCPLRARWDGYLSRFTATHGEAANLAARAQAGALQAAPDLAGVMDQSRQIYLGLEAELRGF